jgi:GT2 family glycosyltransferase
MATVIPCVCTNRTPRAVRACLDALAEQDGLDRVVLVVSGPAKAGGDDVASHEGSARDVLGPRVSVLRSPLPGLSRARNRALVEAADADVFAFIDDDALVGDGWLAGMREAWQRAEPDVACIGGPIRPRFVGDRPRWLSDALLPVLTALDYGPAPRDLDPFETTVYGANVAFRCGPLRDVGGFQPGLGHGGRPTGFGEEDEAQRALAVAGFRVRYEPEPWVWHVIPRERVAPAAFLRRRLGYGAGMGARGARAPGVALRQLASSGAGAPVAAARGDVALAMERATRAAENAGVLLAPLLVRR